MVRLHFRIGLAYQVLAPGADFILNIQASYTPQQRVVSETLDILPLMGHEYGVDPVSGNRSLRLFASPGPLNVNYACTVDITHVQSEPSQVREVPVARLPFAVLPFIYPSRYCPSDSLGQMASALFGHLPRGYTRVQAIVSWVQAHVVFKSNVSHSGTSALDTLRDGVGVCRDFAHLMIALCRALSLPARFVTGIDYGADPALGPTDFHAYVEVYLDHRWYLFDPSGVAIPMGFVRIGTGRDAADVSFATILGPFQSQAPTISITADEGVGGEFELPRHHAMALSTA